MALGDKLKLALIITADSKELNKNLTESQKRIIKYADGVRKIGKTITIMGAAATAAFGAIVMKTTEMGAQLDDMSNRTNIAVEELSALGYAARMSGTSIENVEAVLMKLSRRMNDVANGGGQAKEAFEELGISVLDSQGKLRPTIEVLKEGATKLAEMEDKTKQAALSMDLFGQTSGPELLLLLQQGGDGIEELMKKAEELGIVMSEEAAADAARFSDRLSDLRESLGAAARTIGGILLPPLIDLAERAVAWIKRARQWADENKVLVDTIVNLGAKLAVVAAVGGPILMAAGALGKLVVKAKAASAALGTAGLAGNMSALGTVSAGPLGILIVGGLGVASALDAWADAGKRAREEQQRLKAQDMGLNELQTEIETTSEKIDVLQERVDLLGQSRFLSGDLNLTQLKELQTHLEILKEREKELKEQTEDTTEATENQAESFQEYYERMQKEQEKQKELLEREEQKQKEAREKQEQANLEYEGSIKDIEDRIAELTLSDDEYALRSANNIENLKQKRQEMIDRIKEQAEEGLISPEKEKEALQKIATWWDAEIEALKTRMEEKKEALTEAQKHHEQSAHAELEAIRTVNSAYQEQLDLINAIDEAVATQESAEGIEPSKSEKNTIHIGEDEEGNKIATNQPQNYPDIDFEEMPLYQTGIDRVQRTGPAIIHKDEAVLNRAEANAYREGRGMTFSPNINVTVQGDGDENKIKRVIRNELEKMSREFRRTGYELA